MKMQGQPIRVLEVFGRMDRGGAEAMIMNLYRKMDRRKVQLDFMVHTQDHCQFDDEIEQLGGHIYRVPRFRVYNFLSYRRAWINFFKEHPEHHVIHGHMGATAAIYLHEANKTGRITIAHSHSADIFQFNLQSIFYKLFSYPTRFVAKQFFGCSTEAGIARYGKKIVRRNAYQNFPNAIDLKSFEYNPPIREQKRKELKLRDCQRVIIHVGRVTSPKNPSMLLAIFKEIVRKDNDAVCFWVGTGELANKYRELILHENLQGKIIMTGVRSDIPQLLQAADVFLFPSLWEGLPVSVIEAQAAGLPCVISDTISKEVAVSTLVEWHQLSESPSVWAEHCLSLAESYREGRVSPTATIRAAGYDIEESVQYLSDLYINKSISINQNV